MSESCLHHLSSEAKEWGFRFENSDDPATGEGSCPFELAFPDRFESPPAQSRLTGSFSVAFEPDGEITLTSFQGELSSFNLPLLDSHGTVHLHPTGRLELSLDSLSRAGSLNHKPLPPPNRGFVNPESGYTQLSWGVVAHSPELCRVGFRPIRVFAFESGVLDLASMSWHCAGSGRIVDGDLEATDIRFANSMGPIPMMSLDLPTRIPREGEAPLCIGFRQTVGPHRPQPDQPERFELSATIFGSAGAVQFEPASVEIFPGRHHNVTVATSGLSPGARVQVHAQGAGLCRQATTMAED